MIYLPPWLEWARREALNGVMEVRGEEDNPRIVQYHSFTSLGATDDEVPWCASFVCAALGSTDHTHTHSARARSYLRWGIRLSVPALGCVCILKRGTDDGRDVINAPGHVMLLTDIPNPWEVTGLGGNQSNKVCERSYPVDRVLDYRWVA